MFSVVIPLYNKAKYIHFSIESVLKQTYQQFEIIIVNDGSKDDSLEIIKQQFSDQRIVVLTQENQGVSSARNTGVMRAKYDYVAFLDADDFWEPTFLEHMYETIEQYRDPVILGCQYDVISAHKILGFESNANNSNSYVLKDYFKTAHHNAVFHSSSTVVKTQVLKDLDGFNTSITHGEDLDMWFRIMMLNPLAVFIPIRLSYYFIGDSDQAMATLPVFEKHLVGNIYSMYFSKTEMIDSPYFSVFLKKYLQKNLRPYYVLDKYEFEVRNILQKLDKRYFPYALFYLIPRNLAKFLYKVKKVIR